jgi:hypothetical protein
MMIDDDTLKQLLRINDELLQLCKWLNEKRDMPCVAASHLRSSLVIYGFAGILTAIYRDTCFTLQILQRPLF